MTVLNKNNSMNYPKASSLTMYHKAYSCLASKTSILLCTLFSFLLFTNCETDIPETDTTPPTFSFKISGDGFERTFTQDDDFDTFELYLKNNTTYNFLFTAGDAGGLRTMEWDIEPKSLVEFLEPIEAPWSIVPNSFSDTMWIRWTETDRNNAKTGELLTGNFKCPVEFQNQQMYNMSFLFTVGDFGGDSGPSNTTSKRLHIVISNQNTAVFDIVI
jgi:hypothetical protein|tara:strand:+ start:885 stop:1532 length:648 start_codon:yes stop_codon:yes gene_type:complete